MNLADLSIWLCFNRAVRWWVPIFYDIFKTWAGSPCMYNTTVELRIPTGLKETDFSGSACNYSPNGWR